MPRSPTKIAPDRKVKAATPSPVPSSGLLAPLDGLSCARGPHVLLAKHAVHRGAPTFRGLVPCRSRSWCRPSELSLPGEPCPLSQACASVRVRVRSVRGAAWRGVSRSLSPDGLVPLPSPVPKDVRATPGGATWIPATAVRTLSGRGARPTTRSVSAPSRRSFPRPAELAVNDRHARFEALLPPGVRSRSLVVPAGITKPGRCSPGLFSLQSLLRSRSRCGLSRSSSGITASAATVGGLRHSPEAFASSLRDKVCTLPLGSSCRKRSHPACSAEPSLRPRGLEPGGRRRARSIEPSVPPPGSGRSRLAFMNAHRIRRQPRC